MSTDSDVSDRCDTDSRLSVSSVRFRASTPVLSDRDSKMPEMDQSQHSDGSDGSDDGSAVKITMTD